MALQVKIFYKILQSQFICRSILLNFFYVAWPRIKELPTAFINVYPDDRSRFAPLQETCFHEHRDLDKAIEYAREMIAIAEKSGNQNDLRKAWIMFETDAGLMIKLL